MKETELRILEAAITIFSYDPSTPIENIAQAAGITQRTFYRHFKDRASLLEACYQLMITSCRAAMQTAAEAEQGSIAQLELLLYACIDCGNKFLFLNKGNHNIMPDADQQEQQYQLESRFVSLILTLQDKGVVTKFLTAEWVYQLFCAMVKTANEALDSGSVASIYVKKFAWYSFRHGIGFALDEKPNKV